ncbi:hypothetical protein NQ318_021354 [Aromia moschata]|uniref:Uncharacterized protein n=1 Tax=Aromia moschata TaxID=1265417 RepID=A0AAV8ZC19_9CUCU|nr:hypothetical protein NQ318_021354 [Aromia moschata]
MYVVAGRVKISSGYLKTCAEPKSAAIGTFLPVPQSVRSFLWDLHDDIFLANDKILAALRKVELYFLRKEVFAQCLLSSLSLWNDNGTRCHSRHSSALESQILQSKIAAKSPPHDPAEFLQAI